MGAPEDGQQDPDRAMDPGAWLGIGAGIGLTFGIIYGQLALGLALGTCAGAIVDGMLAASAKRRGSRD
jgi:hypothetical protein